MRPAYYIAVLSVCAILPLAGQQAGAPDQPDQQPEAQPSTRGERPLTPQQLREQQIRMHDPLNKTNPLLGDHGQDPRGQGGTDADTTQATPSRQRSVAAPLPGSVAASNLANAQSAAGPRVITDDAETAVQDYSGPAVLSRSYTISRPQLPQSVRWTPILGFNEIYQTGLPSGAPANGVVTGTRSSMGYNALWGIAGKHLWKHDQIAVDYRGSTTQYGQNSSYNGTNHSLSVDYEHAFSRHFLVTAVSNGNVYSQNYALSDPSVGAGSIANINLSASPNVQLLNQGTRQWSNQASMKWLKSARLSVTAGGGLFFVQRTGVGILGNTGYQAQADLNYRYTRKTTIGVYYTYTNYAFTHRFSLANFHTIGGIYSYALNRSTQFRLRAGMTALESETLATIAIDPVVAALTGQRGGVIDSYQRSITSDLSGQFVKDFGRNRTVNFAYARGVSPGNGLLLTSLQESYSGTFAMVLKRQYKVTFGFGRDLLTTASSLVDNRYASKSVNGSVSRLYKHGINGEFRFDYRKYDISGYSLITSQLRVSTGITWSPGESWLRSLQR